MAERQSLRVFHKRPSNVALIINCFYALQTLRNRINCIILNPFTVSQLAVILFIMLSEFWRQFLYIVSRTLLCPFVIYSKTAVTTGDSPHTSPIMSITHCTPVPVVFKYGVFWLFSRYNHKTNIYTLGNCYNFCFFFTLDM